MQQLLSAFGIDWRLLIAQAVNFGVVIGALWYFLYKPVLAMLAKRQEVIAKGVEDAAHAQAALAGADTEASARVAAADTEAERIVSAAREAGDAEKTRLLKEAEARAVAVAKDAEDRAKEVAARAKRESEKEITRLAILAAEKLLKKHYD
ncbi:ATP synthase F0 subunit B [Patescibacteria group bacterium]|nr:ATP synthase F0 subunit B [Patescibacteria group bacterium]MDE2021359.1 ATP synthase F0 subunit B [Patescibacteria group bacterium]MDE2173044.1 ATP synthase F0 subunit B [Patescibacteria group bacterium]